MSKEYSFSIMPSVSISRSRFARKSQHKTSFNLGEITPIYCDEVLPGDTRSFDMASLVRMSTPIAPIMDNIFIDYYAFFVPNRLTWVHWKEFMGENNVSAGIPSSSYTIPYVGGSSSQSPGVFDLANSVWDHFGLPLISVSSGGTDLNQYKVNALPFRGLALIYNRWFRNQNIIAPLAVQTGDTNEILVGEQSSAIGIRFLKASGNLKASKVADYFTKALPYAQKGQAVSIPLGTSAPVLVTNNLSSSTTLNTTTPLMPTPSYTIASGGSAALQGFNGSVSVGPVVADLSQATAATINQLRYAFQLQKLLEKDALYGTRYWEILNAHFGVQAPDASLQDPEYLGGWRQHVNIDQVLQTTGFDGSTPSNSELGTPGANSVTGGKSSIFTKSFVEHGYIIVVAVARHDQTYHEGINRMWSRSGRYDFYFPVFANLGAQAILKKEIFANGTTTDDQVFGYQEAWAEYRYKPSIVSGKLRPTSGNLNFWTLANNFGSLPTLGQTFIEQGRGNIQRALTTGSSGPDFIADFYFQDIAVRPMPMYSIPGLIDHH